MDLNKLKEPFKENEIEWRVQRSAVKNGKPWAAILAYIDSRAVQDRLDEVVGPENWQTDIRAENNSFLYGLGIRVDGEWIWKWDGSDATKVEAVKGGISGGLKRAAVLWGIGRYLYGLSEQWAIIVPQGKGRYRAKIGEQFYAWNPPALPAWALPGKNGGSEGSEVQVPDQKSPGQNPQTQEKAYPTMGQPEKVDPEASQEVKNSEASQNEPPKWTPEVWIKKYRQLRSGNSMQKYLKEDIKNGTLKVVFRDWIPYRDELFKIWKGLQDREQISRGRNLGAALIQWGFVPPRPKTAEEEEKAKATPQDINDVFGQDPGPPDFNVKLQEFLLNFRFVNPEIPVTVEKFDEFLSERAKAKGISLSDLKEMVDLAGSKEPEVYTRMFKDFETWIKEL